MVVQNYNCTRTKESYQLKKKTAQKKTLLDLKPPLFCINVRSAHHAGFSLFAGAGGTDEHL